MQHYVLLAALNIVIDIPQSLTNPIAQTDALVEEIINGAKCPVFDVDIPPSKSFTCRFS